MKSVTTGTIAVAAVAAIGALVLAFTRTLAVETTYPVERAHRGFVRQAGARLRGAMRGSAAQAENVRLKRENAALAMALEDLNRIERENAQLRQLLNYTAKMPGRWIAAEVLTSGGGVARLQPMLRLGKGSLAGVRVGAVVAVPEGLVGRVSAVTPHTAEVALLTDASVRVHCEIEGETPVRGVLSGGGEDYLTLRHAKGLSSVQSHARVVTTGMGGVFPAGLAVGTYIGVCAGGADARAGMVLPYVDFSALEDVFVRCEK